MNIQGQAALVTGGGSGLGEATARELARLGAKVAVLDLNIDGSSGLRRVLESEAEILPACQAGRIAAARVTVRPTSRLLRM